MKNNYRKIKWGCIGIGDFAEMYISVLRSLPTVDLVSIFSKNTKKLNRIAQKYEIPHQYNDLDNFLNNKEIEAVSICVNRDLHYESLVKSICSGKHVIIEKPIAYTLSDADEVIKLIKNKEVILGVCHIHPFQNNYAKAKDLIEKGDIGEIFSIYSRQNAASFWGDKMQDKFSAIFDEMIHDIEYILWVSKFTNQTGWKVKKVYAQTKNIRGYKYPDICWAMFTFENGCIVTLEANWFLPINTPYLIDQKMEIQGTKGIIYIDVGDQGLKVNDLINGWRYPDVIWWPEKLGNIGGALREEIEYLANCISLGKKPSNELADPVRSRDALEIILAAEKSSEEGKVIYL